MKVRYRIDEAFIRKARKAACVNWRDMIDEQVPDLFLGWFVINSGEAYVWIGKNGSSFAIERIKGEWRITKGVSTRQSAGSIYSHPHNWTKVHSTDDMLPSVIQDLISDCGISINFFKGETLNMNESCIWIAKGGYTQYVFRDGKWLLELPNPEPKMIQFANREVRVSDKDYYIAKHVGHDVWLDFKTKIRDHDENDCTKDIFVYDTQKEAQDKCEEMNWEEGALYWVKLANNTPIIMTASAQQGKFEYGTGIRNVIPSRYRKAAAKGAVNHKRKDEI